MLASLLTTDDASIMLRQFKRILMTFCMCLGLYDGYLDCVVCRTAIKHLSSFCPTTLYLCLHRGVVRVVMLGVASELSKWFGAP